jgi:hypothetical protein
MGFVSDTVLSQGGRSVGVIPSAMIKAGGEGKDTKEPMQTKSGYSETLSNMQREGVSMRYCNYPSLCVYNPSVFPA